MDTESEWRTYESIKNEPLPDIKGEMSYSSHQNNITAEISDDELISLTVRDLNRLLKTSGLTRLEVKRLKQRRRTLKNRGYAASCRNKRLEQKDELQIQRSSINRDINMMKEENKTLESEIFELKKNYESLKQFAMQRNICIPPEFL